MHTAEDNCKSMCTDLKVPLLSIKQYSTVFLHGLAISASQASCKDHDKGTAWNPEIGKQTSKGVAMDHPEKSLQLVKGLVMSETYRAVPRTKK